jgi:hypothetical protein
VSDPENQIHFSGENRSEIQPFAPMAFLLLLRHEFGGGFRLFSPSLSALSGHFSVFAHGLPQFLPQSGCSIPSLY